MECAIRFRLEDVENIAEFEWSHIVILAYCFNPVKNPYTIQGVWDGRARAANRRQISRPASPGCRLHPLCAARPLWSATTTEPPHARSYITYP
jgi:hypothetical protein